VASDAAARYASGVVAPEAWRDMSWRFFGD